MADYDLDNAESISADRRKWPERVFDSILTHERMRDWRLTLITLEHTFNRLGVNYLKRFSTKKKADEFVANLEARQQVFMEVLARKPEEIKNYLLSELEIDETKARVIVPDFPLSKNLTSSEYPALPAKLKVGIYNSLVKDVVPYSLLFHRRFWSLCHIIWIGDGHFGKDIISILCTKKTKKTERGTKLEPMVRSFLDNIGGFERPAFSSHLYESPMAWAWWQCREGVGISGIINSQEEVPISDSRALELYFYIKEYSEIPWNKVMAPVIVVLDREYSSTLEKITEEQLKKFLIKGCYPVIRSYRAAGIPEMEKQFRALEKGITYSPKEMSSWNVLIEVASTGLREAAEELNLPT